MNPTYDVLKKRLAAMKGGVGGVAPASGWAAIAAAIQTIAEAGDNIIAASQLYRGSYNLLAHTLPQQQVIETRFFSVDEPQAIVRLADARTRVVLPADGHLGPLRRVADAP